MKKFFFFWLTFLFFIPFISAELSVNLIVAESFSAQDRISFAYTLFSKTDTEAWLIPFISCPNAPQALQREMRVQLIGGQVHYGIYQDTLNLSLFKPQTCSAVLRISKPEVKQYLKNFSIATLSSFSFETKLCTNPACDTSKKVFMIGEEVFIDYHSTVLDPVVKAVFVSPDGKSKEVSLPYTFKADQTGTFTLSATASRQGYADASYKEQFAVIGKPAEIPTVAVKDIQTPMELRGKVNGPQEVKESDMESYTYFYIIGIIVIVIFIVALIFFLIRSRRKEI